MRIAFLMLAFSPARSIAAGPETFDIPALPVVEAIERLGSRAGLSIGGELRVDPQIRTRAVRGRMSAEAALRRMLRDTGLTVQKAGERSFRLAKRDLPTKSGPAPEPDEAPQEIVVTATKRPVPASLVGGGVEHVGFDSPLDAQDGGLGPTELAARVPSLSSTALGRGRDKLFLRGIADSSFAGATEATLGEYLGEARINFNAPDPGLLLYDVDRVELLKGPQGTLYGGGTLGGVLRIEPKRPDLGRASGFVDATISSTRSGGLGNAMAGILNLPIVEDASGVRLLAYRAREAGYIDDAGRGLKNVNRATTTGGRAQLRVKTGPWRIDVIGTHQRIDSRDSNYASGSLGPLARASRVAQPSRNDFNLLDVEARGPIGADELVSATSFGRNTLGATYDATAYVGSPASFRDARRLTTFNHETRLVHSAPNGAGWVAGIAAFAEHEAARQSADQPVLAGLASNLRSDRLNLALFGQGSLRVGDLLLTAGLRGTYAWQRARTDLELAMDASPVVGRSELNLSPMGEFTWFASKKTSLSFSVRQGFRSGGFSIYRLDQQVAGVLTPGFYPIRYAQDLIRVASLEVNHHNRGTRPLDLNVAISAVRWNSTQGSIVDEYGFLYSANTNGTTIFNLDLSASWRVRPALSLRAGSSFTTRARIGPGTAVAEVPSVPNVAAYGSADWEKSLSDDWKLGVEGRVGYRGRSRLGYGFLHDIDQGDALFTSLGARLTRDAYSVSLSVENLANDHASLFSYGNPFTIQTERQRTPQRPRTVSVGFHAAF